MVAKQSQDQRDDKMQDLTDKVARMEIIQRDVIQPNLKTIVTDVKTIMQSGYLTKAEADNKYAAKDEVKFLKTLVYSLLTGFAVFIMGIATGIIGVNK